MESIDELVSLIDLVRASDPIPSLTAQRIVEIVRDNPQHVHVTLHALYEMQRNHPHHDARGCARCAELGAIIAPCEGLIARSLPKLDYLDEETTSR